MAIDQIFVDTCALLALVDKDDQFHQRSKKMWQELENKHTRLVCSNLILNELLTLSRRRGGLTAVEKVRRVLAENAEQLKVHRISAADEQSAWQWFMFDLKNLSFTDCTSFALMKRLEIEQVFTFDKHFAQVGFALV